MGDIATVASMPRAYSYLRFSTPEQAKGDSYRRQSELARDYAARQGLDLDDRLTFHDLGVSGFRGANSETGRLADFRAAVTGGLVARGSYLLVESLDRVSRQAARRALRVLEEIVDLGVAVVTLNDGRVYDLDALDRDPGALLMALLIFIRANEESETKSRRLKASWAGRRAKAAEKPITSRGPAWLRLEEGRWHVLEERAAVVLRVFAMAGQGVGENAIAATLNRDGVATWGDNGRAPAVMWHRSYVRKLLESPAVVGTLVPHTMLHAGQVKRREAGVAVPNYYPAVVSSEAWAAVASMRGTVNPARGRHAGMPLANVLGGLGRCSACGKAMTRVTKGASEKAGRARLLCTGAKTGTGCSFRPISCEAVEEALRVGFPVLANGGPQSDLAADAAALIPGLEARVAEIVATVEGMFRSGTVIRDPDGWDIVAALNAEKRDLYDQIGNLRTYGHFMAEPVMRRRLDELQAAVASDPMDITAANTALRGLFDHVTVDVDGAALRFAWKSGETTALPVAVEPPSERASRRAKRSPREKGGRFMALAAE